MSQKKQAASSARAGGITDGVIWEQLLVFFFPILFGAFFQQLYNTVDTVVVGRFTGSLELAAVGGSTGTLLTFYLVSLLDFLLVRLLSLHSFTEQAIRKW